MKLIIRFECAEGYGVYHAGGVANDYYDYERHPLPIFDGGLNPWWRNMNLEQRRAYRFGFGCVGQARAWFYDVECLRVMAEIDDVRLVVYRVPEGDYEVGFSQAVFLRRDAEIVAEYEPVELHHRGFPAKFKALEQNA